MLSVAPPMSRKVLMKVSSPTALFTLRDSSRITKSQDLPIWYVNWFRWREITFRTSSWICLSINFSKVRNYDRCHLTLLKKTVHSTLFAAVQSALVPTMGIRCSLLFIVVPVKVTLLGMWVYDMSSKFPVDSVVSVRFLQNPEFLLVFLLQSLLKSSKFQFLYSTSSMWLVVAFVRQ